MIIVTTLVIPVYGDAGPFDLYTDSDGFAVPFATNVSAAALEAGYSSTVPDDATIVRVVSVGLCTNYIDLDITLLPTTTTTSSSTSSSTSTSTSTTTSTSSSTTTTTTAIPTTTTSTTTVAPEQPLSGTWDLQSVNANVQITSINNLSGEPVSCVGATFCSFPIYSTTGHYQSTPPTSNGITPISTSTTATLVLNLSWISPIGGATYWFSINVTGQSTVFQFVTYGTPFVTLNIAGLTTGSEDVTILFTGTF